MEVGRAGRRLDTGCTDALIWSGRAEARTKLAGRSVAACTPSSRQAASADVAAGGLTPSTMPVKWCGREIFPGEAGLLGNAALGKYRAITIDGIGKRLILLALSRGFRDLHLLDRLSAGLPSSGQGAVGGDPSNSSFFALGKRKGSSSVSWTVLLFQLPFDLVPVAFDL